MNTYHVILFAIKSRYRQLNYSMVIDIRIMATFEGM